MSELRSITASAGTGKTHRLAEELLDALTSGGPGGGPLVVPEAVVAVTYTRSAAAELEARVRKALVERGEIDLARRLQNARIGTVHAVCTRLIEEHAFALGLPPELTVLDKRAASAAFDDALAAVVTDAERQQVEALTHRLPHIDFDALCRSVASRARSNGIGPDALDESRRESLDSLRANLPTPKTAVEIEGAMCAAIDAVLPRLQPKKGATLEAVQLHASLLRMREALQTGELPPWSDWLLFEKGPVQKAARAHVEHPQLGADLLALIDLVFTVTRRAMERYRDDKREQGVVDFVDMEELAVALLARRDLQEILRGEIQLLLIDEFQDTSPLALALYTSLHTLTARTVIVGDEKQAIFGFRDADPRLFRDFAGLATSRARLDVSYRSRPGLVRAVSAIFRPAFLLHSHGPGASPAAQVDDDVTLTPHHPADPAALGPHVERWTDDTGDAVVAERRSEIELIACGVAELLSTRDVLVRVPGRTGDDGQPLLRIATARDIAVLCRTNSAARNVAKALAERGVPALLRRRGLAETWEARVLSAALSLWLDDNDVLARASLVRLLEGGDGATLLPRIVDAEKGEALADHPDVVAVVTAATELRTAGLVRAIDRVVDVLALRDRAARLGDANQRLADLAALRALAVRFVDHCFARGAGPTIPGFLARLEQLRSGDDVHEEDDEDDERGDVAGKDAVTILTWHKAKGREWPIVVLAGMWTKPRARTFDVTVDAHVGLTSGGADPMRPLFGRRVRLWPSPYGDTAKGGLVHALKTSLPVQRAEKAARLETLRLLYVGFTRARDRLVVIGDHTVWTEGMMTPLTDAHGPVCGDAGFGIGTADWGPRGATVPVVTEVRSPSPHARLPLARQDRVLPPQPTGARPARPPMFVQPSATKGAGRAGTRSTLGPPMAPKEVQDEITDLNHLGQCLHAFFAVDAFLAGATDDDARSARRHALASRVRQGFSVERMLTTGEVVTLGTRLWRFLDERLPGACRRTEVPLLFRRDDGSVVRGQIDLLLDAGAGGVVIVDHKTTFDADVEGYAGQLSAYRDAVVASGLVVRGTWIHLPLLGQMVEVLLDDEPETSG